MVDIENLSRAPLWVRAGAQVVKRLPAGRYRLMNALPRPAESFLARLPEASGGYVFACDLRDTIAREACFTGQYEPQETLLLHSLLRPGHCFVDVGANWGYHTLLAAHLVGKSGRVISFEPDPRLFPILQRNIEQNNLTQVTALQVAAADAAGELPMAGFALGDGNFGLSRLVVNGDAAGVFNVATERLDDALVKLGVDAIDLLKMDIEGAEGLALSGLAEYLQAGRVQRLLLELHPAQLAERGAKAADIIKQLQNYGYRGWKIAHSLTDYRRTAYSNTAAVQDIIRPVQYGEPLDDWPHILWCAPGLEI